MLDRAPRHLLATRVPILSLKARKARNSQPARTWCQMTSIADRIPGPPLVGAADAAARAAVPAATMSFPVLGGERELRLDLFRGLALWLIFIDHLPPNLFAWVTGPNSRFS